MAKQAVEHVRRLRGGAQSHLLRCDDGDYYVVKFKNNPQGVRILANEMLAGKLARTLGLPVPEPEVVEVSEWLVEHTPEMYIQWGAERIPCASGFQFGSRFPCDPLRTPVYDFLPDSLLPAVANRDSFPGILVFDKWTCNCDSRQLVFHRSPDIQSYGYVASMIDQGFCFNANEWNFPDSPMRGLYSRLSVYEKVVGLDSFEPFLGRLEHLTEDFLEEAAASVPPEWYEGKTEELRALIGKLAERRTKVARLIRACRQSARQPFPGWSDNA
ncbi:MAG: phosphatidylinositol kinase [Acidobacteria bacterium]|nr:phosphatidylinositol kinase [Acidobacteriota bacterium]